MKKIILLMFLLLPVGIQAKDFVSDYVAVSPKGFNLQTVTQQQCKDMITEEFSKQAIPEAEFKEVTAFFGYLKEIRTLMFEKRELINKKTIKKLAKSYELIADRNKEGDSWQIFMKEKEGIISEIIVIAYSNQTPLICSVTGKIPLDYFLESENSQVINVGDVPFSDLLKDWRVSNGNK